MVLLIALLFSLTGFSQVDPEASASAKVLLQKLETLSTSIQTSQQKILLGQQNAFTEGRGWRLSNNDRGKELHSDMHDVAGIHPNLLGIDFGEIGPWNKDLIVDQMREVHKRGGVITMSWHMPALIDDGKGDGSFFDTTTKIIREVLPGKQHHNKLTEKLDTLAAFFLELGEVPVIFRPWHEHNASWFWWGEKHSSRREFRELWQFTVKYLASKGVHNLLFAYSPNQIKKDYLDRYPGDEYVDILGTDHYFYSRLKDIGAYGPWPLSEYKRDVIWLCREAVKRNKIPAITEFGLESSYYNQFWTDYMGWPLEKEGMAQLTDDVPLKGPAYVMLWRNDIKDPKHFFGPVPGHSHNQNFMDLLSKGIYLGL